MNNFKIVFWKKFIPGELNNFKSLISQLNPKYLENVTLERLKRIVKEKNSNVFVARNISNEIVGMGVLVIYSTITGDKAWIEDVVLEQKNRGKGIGKEIMKRLIKEAKKRGIREVNLTSNPKRVEAFYLYKKLGFKEYKTRYFRLEIK